MNTSFTKTAVLLCLVATLGGCGQQKELASYSSVAEPEQEDFSSLSSVEDIPVPEEPADTSPSGYVLDTPVGTSPSGNYSVFLADFSAGGDGYMDELVSRNNKTSQVVELGAMSSPQAYIFPQRDVLIVAAGYLEEYDLATGARSLPVPDFDLNVPPKEGELVLLQALHDAENELIVLVCAPWHDVFVDNFTPSSTDTYSILVYDEDWNLQNTIATEIPAIYSGKTYGPGVEMLEVFPERREIVYAKAGPFANY